MNVLFGDGFYSQKKEDIKQKVYVDVEDEQLMIHSTKKKLTQTIIDSLSVCEFYPQKIKNEIHEETTFSGRSFDIDF